MSLRVYHADSSPATDPPSYRLSNHRAQQLVADGQGKFISLADGRTAVQLFRPRAGREIWLERLEQATKSSSSMPLLRFVPPKHESWRKTQAESKIVNLRRLVTA